MKSKQYYVYIVTSNKNTVLYTGVSEDLVRRVYQHKTKFPDGFTAKYHVDKLVNYEIHEEVTEAIKREKQIKNLVRRKKIELIDNFNPEWKDLYPTIL